MLKSLWRDGYVVVVNAHRVVDRVENGGGHANDRMLPQTTRAERANGAGSLHELNCLLARDVLERGDVILEVLRIPQSTFCVEVQLFVERCANGHQHAAHYLSANLLRIDDPAHVEGGGEVINDDLARLLFDAQFASLRAERIGHAHVALPCLRIRVGVARQPRIGDAVGQLADGHAVFVHIAAHQPRDRHTHGRIGAQVDVLAVVIEHVHIAA